MIIDQERVEKFIKKLPESLSCPICKCKHFIYSDYLDELYCYDDENGEKREVFLTIVCDECGYTYFFNAKKSGLIKED